jgi:DNA-binding transcriptional ArsR family regulator
MPGDADLAAVGSLVAEPARARILLALGDGRALPASILAHEAGVAPSTASAHLGRMLDGGLLAVEHHGRHRYYRLAGPEVAELIEAIARLAPAAPIRSLRQGTQAGALRFARTCYDHLAGVVGAELMGALITRGILVGGDGRYHAGARDRLSAPGSEVDYRLTDAGLTELESFGVDFAALPRRRPLIRYCVDWSEQRHHLAGALGAVLTARLLELEWITRAPRGRSVRITETGERGLRARFGIDVGALRERQPGVAA